MARALTLLLSRMTSFMSPSTSRASDSASSPGAGSADGRSSSHSTCTQERQRASEGRSRAMLLSAGRCDTDFEAVPGL